MSGDQSKKLVSKLRFPELQDAGLWEEVSINQMCETFSGGTPSTTEKSFYGGEIPFIRSAEISSEITELFLTEYGLKNSSAKLVKKGDVLVALYGANSGDVAVSRINGGINQAILCLQSGSELKNRFISQYLTFQKNYIVGKYIQGGQGNLSGEIVKSIKIPLPPNKSNDDLELKKIVDCLSSIDDLITAQSQKIEALKQHKKGLMQQLFPAEGETIPQRRFPEFENAGEWVEIKLIDTADKKTKWSFIGGPFGSNLKSSDYVHQGVRVIQLQNIGDGEFLDEYKIFTSEDKANELLSNNIYPDEIILSKMGDPVGRACLIPNKHDRYVMCSDGIRLVVDEGLYSKYFVYTLINSDYFRALLDKTATGSTRKRIGLDDLKNLPMTVPKKKAEQQMIADCLLAVDDLITTQTEKLEALKQHKKGLMQQLFPSLDENVA